MSTSPRLSASSRFAGALLGAIVAAVGVACIAVYSGHDLDLELLGIVLLAGAGVWLLLSALAASFSGARRSRKAASAPSGASLADDADPIAPGSLRDSARSKAESAKTEG